MDSIFFSIIIPTYNRCDLLRKAVNSVLTQTYKNFEIIIIDNYSNDNTQELVESFTPFKYKEESKYEGTWFIFEDDKYISVSFDKLFDDPSPKQPIAPI